jgi:hypothetical protein
VSEKDTVWKTPILLSRKQINRHLTKETGISISHGDYFHAVRSFLMQNRFETLTPAVAHHLNRDIRPEEIEEIRIVLEKHGEFYHPARIEVVGYGKVISFVVNVAVSHVGNEYILKEFRLMQRLNTDFQHSFIPNVYGEGEVPIKGGDLILRMFLGEWFEGFNEFHITRDNTDEKLKLIVWDPVYSNFFLSEDQAKELYSQAAMILTYYYNIETFEQISLWHHAAGDFVVKLQDGEIDLRLITVRRYAPMFGEIEVQEEASASQLMLEALLVFFLNLTIRTRLDRLDGIGDLVWSDNIAIEGTLRGFFRGLALKSKDGLMPEQLVDFFQNYLLRCTEADLFDLTQAIVDQYNPRTPEMPVVTENIKEHTAVLYRAIHHI